MSPTMAATRASCALATLLLAAAACSPADDTAESSAPASPSQSVSSTTTPDPSTSDGASTAADGVPVLEDGPITPGRYAFELTYPKHCSPRKDPIYCPRGIDPPPPMNIEVTVPEGWNAANEFHLIERDIPDGTSAPDGAALVLGWTSYHVGLNSDPCLSEDHEIPDTKVGPTVDDFVDAVVANDNLDISTPQDVQLDGHPGRFFTLQAPDDLSGCVDWRPWDPGFYAQGPSNQWDVWVIDVAGHRVLIVTNDYPGTPGKTKADLRRMVESISFELRT